MLALCFPERSFYKPGQFFGRGVCVAEPEGRHDVALDKGMKQTLPPHSVERIQVGGYVEVCRISIIDGASGYVALDVPSRDR